MYKLVVIAALVAVALAEPGYVATSGLALPYATSYANTYGAPLAYASAPIYSAHQRAAIAYSASPALYNAAPYPYVSSAYIH